MSFTRIGANTFAQQSLNELFKVNKLIGKSLIDSNIRKDYGAIIVAIKKVSGDMIFNPMPSEKLEGGDVIVILGKKEDLKRMRTVL